MCDELRLRACGGKRDTDLEAPRDVGVGVQGCNDTERFVCGLFGRLRSYEMAASLGSSGSCDVP